MATRPLRRADRAASHDETLAVLDEAQFATLSTIDEQGAPYGVPCSFVRSGSTLYLHATNESGCKFDCFRRDARICATAVVGVEAFFAAGDFSTSYRSAIAFGRIRRVDDPVEFKRALVDLCMKYVPEAKREIGEAMRREGPHASVWAIDIDELSGKQRSKPSDDSEEANPCA